MCMDPMGCSRTIYKIHICIQVYMYRPYGMQPHNIYFTCINIYVNIDSMGCSCAKHSVHINICIFIYI